MDFNEGEILLIDKPYKWTSFDAVKKIRGGLRIKKIGHAGTLDPLATGLLIMCTGKMTKKIDELQAKEKEYTGEFILGKTTPSIDIETPFDSEVSTDHLTENTVKVALRNFLGTIEQTPPIYSAIKVDGERLYEKARKGENAEIKSRKVFIKEFLLTEINIPSIKFKIVCSKGTYIRSIVRDFGELLKVGAYLNELRRTRIGDFSIKDAESPLEFVQRYRVEGGSK
ncbi:MAG TPA: tRNA pseudouridine(55) synthase TruB [Cytophagales bacterium]|nr:tRNA pseudouridine(55) synthase TruB [Cytophagales bacterium]